MLRLGIDWKVLGLLGLAKLAVQVLPPEGLIADKLFSSWLPIAWPACFRATGPLCSG